MNTKWLKDEKELLMDLSGVSGKKSLMFLIDMLTVGLTTLYYFAYLGAVFGLGVIVCTAAIYAVMVDKLEKHEEEN